MLKTAYVNIKSNSGISTKKVDTLDGIKESDFIKLSKEIATGMFKFKPYRIVDIPIGDGKIRKIGIASERDKIVQEVMRMILDAVFTKNFKETSHGYIKGRGCHTALNQIKMEFGYVN